MTYARHRWFLFTTGVISLLLVSPAKVPAQGLLCAAAGTGVLRLATTTACAAGEQALPWPGHGPKGDPGPTGPPGPRGPAGPSGKTGAGGQDADAAPEGQTSTSPPPAPEGQSGASSSSTAGSTNSNALPLPYQGTSTFGGYVFRISNTSKGTVGELGGTEAGAAGRNNDGPGVLGISTTGRGVQGQSDSKGGVVGMSNSGDGIAGATQDQNAAGVVGVGHRGGWFQGNVAVQGILAVTGAKQFQIDDPLDPANKYLFHASIESSEALNLYAGEVVLDRDGQAVVHLPDWFEAVNADFRYQLTAVGGPAPSLYVAKKISANQFTIAGGQAGQEVSWQVIAARHDVWVRDHPMHIEEDKPVAERGTYIYPQGFGQPAERSVAWKLHPDLMRAMCGSSSSEACGTGPLATQHDDGQATPSIDGPSK